MLTTFAEKDPMTTLATGLEVEKKKIVGYFNEYYYSAIVAFNRFKRYRLPWLVGYQEMPEYLIIIYDVFEYVIGLGDNPKVAKARNKARNK